jgi:molybdenum cofactor cytidylyltransferase
MSAGGEPFVVGLVLPRAAPSGLGRPKQLLRYGTARCSGTCSTRRAGGGFDQTLCVVGGAAGEVKGAVDFAGVQLVENCAFGEGCSSSIAAALARWTPRRRARADA